MFKKDGITYANRAEWQLDNQIVNSTKKPNHHAKRKHKNYHKNHIKTEVWHMKEFTMDIPLTARCALRLTKSTQFHTNNGKPSNYDWKHCRIEIVLDDKPVKATAPGKDFETGDIIPIEFEIRGQHFMKHLVNVKDSIFTVEDSKEAKQIIREVQKQHM